MTSNAPKRRINYLHRPKIEQRRASKRLARRNADAMVCQKRIGQSRCGGLLEPRADRTGRVYDLCPHCDRQRRGICRDCPHPVEGQRGRALRCAIHKRTARQAQDRIYHRRYPERAQQKERVRFLGKPEKRAARLELRRAWRKANPDIVRAYKLAETTRGNAKTDAYHAAYRKKHARKRRRREWLRHRGLLPPRKCIATGCRIVVTGRKKKCSKCRDKDRVAALAVLRAVGYRPKRTTTRITTQR